MANAAANRLPKPVREYLAHTRRPLVCLAFAAPLLVVYEIGVRSFPDAARNGADVWMRTWLEAVGLGGLWLLPLLTIGVLLGWHHTTRQPWRLPRGVLIGMTAESVTLGLLLLAAARLLGGWVSAELPVADIPVGDQARLWVAKPAVERLLARVIEYVGAGIYEEVLFRLLLLPACIAALAGLLADRGYRTAAAVIITSAMFAAAHHAGAHGEAWQAGVFVFRMAAGVFFAVLFLRRGFGVAIGAHAAYDIIAGLLYR